MTHVQNVLRDDSMFYSRSCCGTKTMKSFHRNCRSCHSMSLAAQHTSENYKVTFTKSSHNVRTWIEVIKVHLYQCSQHAISQQIYLHTLVTLTSVYETVNIKVPCKTARKLCMASCHQRSIPHQPSVADTY